MSQRRISDPELAALWRIHRSTLATWHTEGVLTSDGRAKRAHGRGGRPTHWYHISTITELHRKGLRNKSAKLPPVSELLTRQTETGKPSLLTPGEAAQRLDMSQESVMAEIYAGALGAFQLPNELTWRVPVQCLAAYQTSPDAVKKELAAEVLGIVETSVGVLMVGANAPLKRVKVRRSGNHVFVSAASLLAFIGKHLARKPNGETFLTAREWWEMRELYEFEELLTGTDIKARYHVHTRVIQRLIQDGTFPCLYTVGGQARIPLHAVEEWNVARVAVPATFLAQVTGLTEQEAAVLIATPDFCVRRHGTIRPSPCPTPTCVAMYVAANKIGSLDADDWIADATQGGMQRIALSIGGEEGFTLIQSLENNRIHGVKLPDGRISVPLDDWEALCAAEGS